MDKWTELRTAYQVAKFGTVSAASENIGVHRATVNRHIDILEEELGAPVFIRHAKGYTLTELGEELLRVAQKTEELMDDLSGRAKGGSMELEGEIIVTVLPHFTKMLTAPIEQFRAKNPNCRVTIIASEDLARLEYGEAHVAIRVGAKPDHLDYVVSDYGSIGLNLYAHDAYIQRKGMPKGAHDLADHEFAVPSQSEGRAPFMPWISENVSAAQISISSQHYSVVNEAVFAGLGLGFLTDVDVADRTDVHAVLPADNSWSIPVWLVTHVDLHRTEKVQAMLTCLKTIREKSSR